MKKWPNNLFPRDDLVAVYRWDNLYFKCHLSSLSFYHHFLSIAYCTFNFTSPTFSFFQIECDLVMLANIDHRVNAQISYLVHDLSIYNPALPRYVPSTLLAKPSNIPTQNTSSMPLPSLLFACLLY